jgi:hypothetical protein
VVWDGSIQHLHTDINDNRYWHINTCVKLEQFCERLKQDAATSLTCVFPLLRDATIDETTRHFALHLLENVVRSHWASLDAQVRESIKSTILEYLVNVCIDINHQQLDSVMHIMYIAIPICAYDCAFDVQGNTSNSASGPTLH